LGQDPLLCNAHEILLDTYPLFGNGTIHIYKKKEAKVSKKEIQKPKNILKFHKKLQEKKQFFFFFSFSIKKKT